MNLLEQVKKLPLSPGVYLFLNKNKKPLYVGKATSLRRRVISYFQKQQDPRLAEMIDSAVKIKYYKTDSVLEALVLEANLIKKYWPKYNVKEKDNRSFIYIVIPRQARDKFPRADGSTSLTAGFPRPFIVRQRELEKFPQDRVFGPYQSLSAIKNGLRIIRKIFPYSTCLAAGKPAKNSGKPCFDYQIGLCPGACVNKISKEEYQKNIDNLILFLRGEKKKLFKKLKNENQMAIQSLKHIQDVALISREDLSQGTAKFNRIEGYDISHLTGKETVGSMVVFIDGKADNSQYRLFNIKEAPANDDLRALEEMITRRFRHPEWHYPDLIMIDGGKPQISFISKTFKKLNISIPIVGISKFGGDKLVFQPKVKSSLKELIQTEKGVLLKVREEAHRFALKTSRRQRKLSAK